MKPFTNTSTRRTSSAELAFSFGFSIVMHAVILLVDPLASFNVSDRLKEQNGILMVNLKDRAEEGRRKDVASSKPASVRKVSRGNREKKFRKKMAASKPLPSLPSKAPVITAKPVSPVDQPVHGEKAARVDSAPVAPVPVPVPSSDAPPPAEPAPQAEHVQPVPAQEKVPEHLQPSPIEPDEPDITVTDTLKKKKRLVTPVDQQPDLASSDLPKEEIAKEGRSEKISPPALQEIQEPIKPEAPPPARVVAAAVEPEETHAAPVKQEPAPADEQRVASPEQEVPVPIKPEAPPLAPVVAAATVPEESHAAPVRQEPIKADEPPVASRAPKEVPQNLSPPLKTDQMKAEESLPKQSTKPIPVIAEPREVREEAKGVLDHAKDREPPAKSSPAAPSIRAERAVEKAAELPAKAVDAKAAVVSKKTISLSLLRRFGTDQEPIRIGTPIGRPMIKITTPAAKKVSSMVQEIGGRVKGNGITRVILSVNGDSVTVPVEHDKFHWEGALTDGKNTLSATAWDRNRYSATDQIIVEAMPARNGFALSLEEPGPGEVASPVITVKGSVGDGTVDTVRLLVNREFVEAAVENGAFEKTVLFQAGENTLQAEAVNAKGVSARSSVLQIKVLNRKTPDILVHLYWEDPDSDLRAEVARKQRDNLDDEQGVVTAVEVSAVMSAREGYREKIFAVYDAKAGAYVLSVTGGKPTRCLLAVTLPAKRKTRLFGPILIGEEGTFIDRLLMPEGIYWDEDEWFTGKIENGDSVTKYNSPEGMTWKEMK